MKNQSGFGHVGVVIALLVLAIIGFGGWRVWESQKKDETPQTVQTLPNEEKPITHDEKNHQELTLAGVTIKAPETWSENGLGCIANSGAYSNQTLLASTSLLPGEKLPTIYGSGTEYFHVRVCVFENKNNLTPKNWYSDSSTGGIGMGIGSDNMEESVDEINGNPGYYRKDSPSYEEVSYVVNGKGKIVLVTARTYETSKDLPGVGDFREFEPAIKELTQSIRIN